LGSSHVFILALEKMLWNNLEIIEIVSIDKNTTSFAYLSS